MGLIKQPLKLAFYTYSLFLFYCIVGVFCFFFLQAGLIHFFFSLLVFISTFPVYIILQVNHSGKIRR